MGAKFSPSLANIYMSWWENQYLYSMSNTSFSSILWFSRYIDDLLFVIRNGENLIPEFTEFLNSNCLGLSFTVTSHTSKVSFLDLSLFINESNLVATRTFRKENAGNTILQARSHHPRHTIENIPLGEMLRARQNCSSDSDFDKEVIEIETRLHSRQYPNK